MKWNTTADDAASFSQSRQQVVLRLVHGGAALHLGARSFPVHRVIDDHPVDGVREGSGGADVAPLLYQRVPVLSVAQDTSRYFEWHHSAADTLDKVDPRELAEATAALAWLGWALADGQAALARPEPPSDPPWWKPAPAAGRGASGPGPR